jgi:hypothetical protein
VRGKKKGVCGWYRPQLKTFVVVVVMVAVVVMVVVLFYLLRILNIATLRYRQYVLKDQHYLGLPCTVWLFTCHMHIYAMYMDYSFFPMYGHLYIYLKICGTFVLFVIFASTIYATCIHVYYMHIWLRINGWR